MRIEDCNWMQVERVPARATTASSCRSARSSSTPTCRSASTGSSPSACRSRPPSRSACSCCPSLPYGLTPYFAAYPGSPTLRVETYRALLRDLLDSFHDQGFRRFLFVNGHGGNDPGRAAVDAWDASARGRAGALAQLVGGHADARGRRLDRPRRVARLVVRELPVDTAARRRASRRSGSRWPTSRGCASSTRPPCASCSATARSAASTSARTRTCCAVWQAGVEEVRDADRRTAGAVPDLGRPRRDRHRHGARDRLRDRRRARGARRDRARLRPRHRRRHATPAQVDDFVAAIGRVDILVNNAGGVVGQVGRPLEEVSDDDWRAVVDANLTSTFVCTRAVAPGMKAAALRAHRQHLVGCRPQRQPHRHPGVREREGRADRLHAPDRARARAVRDHGQLDRAGLRALEPDVDRAVRELRRGGTAAADRVDRDAPARHGRRTSRTACSSSSRRSRRG